MTNEEAIEVLAQDLPCETDEDLVEAMAMAIKALEPQPCEDCISRQAVLDQAVDYGSNTYLIPVNSVKTLPSVTPKEKTGKWIYKLEDWNKWTCSECGFSKRTDVHVKLRFNFCPNCGARMVSE